MSKEYTQHGKLKVGPGGIGCPCCNPKMGQQHGNGKRKAHRLVRRKAKLTITSAYWDYLRAGDTHDKTCR